MGSITWQLLVHHGAAVLPEVGRLSEPTLIWRYNMRVFAILMLPWIVTLPTAVDAQDRYICPGNGSDLQQLRVYEIDRSNKNAFHRRFQDHAVRIMKLHDFRSIDMWERDKGEKIEFVDILSWPNKATINSRWQSFLADKEWIEQKKKKTDEK